MNCGNTVMAVAITEDSNLDVNYNKDSSTAKNTQENESTQQGLNIIGNIENCNQRSKSTDAIADIVPIITNNKICDFNNILTQTQDVLKSTHGRLKGRTLLHRLASFAAATNNTNCTTISPSPSRQLEKLAKKSLRLSSSSSLLMEILKLNNNLTEEHQQHQQQELQQSNLNVNEFNKCSSISTSYQMLASQLLYAKLLQQTSPLVILDYSPKCQTNSNNSEVNEENINNDEHTMLHNIENDLKSTQNVDNIDLEYTPNIKTEKKDIQQVSTELSNYNPTDDAKILDLWHEKLNVLTQAHLCLEQFLEINNEMQNIFQTTAVKQTYDQQILNNFEDQKGFIEAIIAKLNHTIRYCNDSRQLYVRKSQKKDQQNISHNSSAATPDLKPDTSDLFIKQETTNNINDDSRYKIKTYKNVWQPFVNESLDQENICENEGDKVIREEHFTDQIENKTPVCFWHPKNLGKNINEKAVSAVEIILECAAKKETNEVNNIELDCQTNTSSNITPPNTQTHTQVLNTCSSPFLPSTPSVSSTSPLSNISLNSNHAEDATGAPVLNMLMADCGKSSFLTALSNRALINLVSNTTANINTNNIQPITTTTTTITNHNYNRNLNKTLKNQETNPPTTNTTTNATLSNSSFNTASCYVTNPPKTQVYNHTSSAAAAAVAALQEKALSDMFKVRFTALTAAAVINAASVKASGTTTATTNSNNNIKNNSNNNNVTNLQMNSEGPYDLSIGNKFKKM